MSLVSIILQLTKGFSNWKDTTISFRHHKTSQCHNEAVERMLTAPATTRDIGEVTVHSMKFLGRQGICIRSHDDKEDGNFYQLFKGRSLMNFQSTEFYTIVLDVVYNTWSETTSQGRQQMPSINVTRALNCGFFFSFTSASSQVQFVGIISFEEKMRFLGGLCTLFFLAT